MITLYRFAVLLSLLFYILWFLYPQIAIFQGKPELYNLLQANGAGAVWKFPDTFLWALFVLWVVVSIGLILFYRWARTLYIFLVGFSLLLLPFSGVSVDLAVGSFFSEATSILDGFILAFSFFFGPINNEFMSDRYKI